MTRDRQTRFVHFDCPPVVEVVCGIVTTPVRELTTAAFGLLWERFGDEFVDTADQTPLPPPGQQGEQDPRRQQDPHDLVMVLNLPRVWFVSEDERRLIQVQKDRFLFNWRRRADGDDYPTFPRVYDDFKRHLGTLEAFLADGGVAPAAHVQYELTYVNHVPVDDVWADLGGMGSVFPDIAWNHDESRFLPPPSQIRWEAMFLLPEGSGTLNASVRTMRHRETGALLLAFTLTARGPAGTLEMDEWFSTAHEWIVRGFADLTGPEMHSRVWKRKDDSP